MLAIAPQTHQSPHLHPDDITTCGDCSAALFDTNRSMLREITSFVSLPYEGYEEIIGALLTEDLQSAIQRAVLHGIEIGRDAQRQEDRESLEEYRDSLVRMRQERDEEREINLRYRDQMRSKDREVQDTQDRLVAVQMAFDDMQVTMMGAVSLRDESPPPRRQPPSSDSEDSDSEFWVPGSDDELDDYEVAQMFALMEEDFLLQREIWDARAQPAVKEDTAAIAVPETLPAFQQGPSIINVTPRVTQQRPGVVDVAEMRRLMRLAHEPNQGGVVNTIKKALLTAERTPKAGRTPAQRYLLKTWKKPRRFRHPGALPLSLRDTAAEEAEIKACNHEIIVDASYFGIGFICKFAQDMVGWVGWRFASQAVIPLGPDERIIMSWAEMIAVEAGLRAFIAQGYRACNVLLRSDNMGVIKAIKNRTWMEKYGLNEILQRVLELCQQNEIKLVPLWIWTEENPADAISRGKYPSMDQKLWVPISLSSELGPILYPV